MSQSAAVKTVFFFGEEIVIPDHHDYVACDTNGAVFSYFYRPEFSRDGGYWLSSDPDDLPQFIMKFGHVDTDKAQRMMENYHVS